jgi:hypothetical protein
MINPPRIHELSALQSEWRKNTNQEIAAIIIGIIASALQIKEG